MQRTLFEFKVGEQSALPKGPCYIEAFCSGDALVVEVNSGKFHTVRLDVIQRLATIPSATPKPVTPKFTLREAFEYVRDTWLPAGFKNSFTKGSCTVSMEAEDLILVQRDHSSWGCQYHETSIYSLREIQDFFKVMNVPFEDFINGRN